VLELGVMSRVRQLAFKQRYRLMRPLRDLEDVRALAALEPLTSGERYLAWSPMSMRPSAMALVVNEITIGDRRRIVECGSGISTLLIARLLRTRPGHLWSVEHDRDWRAIVSGWVEDEGLADRVTFIDAGLSDGWYCRETISTQLKESEIDLLIVDGPPAYRREIMYARYQAVPFFRERLASDWAIVLDDVHRRGEFEVASRWSRELRRPMSPQLLQGVGLARAGASFAV
jgi:predicted O-methyltransferase YrrM